MTDTSTANVEAVAYAFNGHTIHCKGTSVDMSALLRALLAERDAAVSNRAHMIEEYACTLKAVVTERDALQAHLDYIMGQVSDLRNGRGEGAQQGARATFTGER